MTRIDTLWRRAKKVWSCAVWATVRVLLLFVLISAAIDQTSRLAAQLSPTWYYFELSRIQIQPGGQIVIVYRKSFHGDLPVSAVVELIGSSGFQPCADSGRRVIEDGTSEAVVPISRLLPNCRWENLNDGRYRLQITASYPAGGTFDKSITRRSENSLIVKEGRIAGSTVPSQETGALFD